MKIVFLSLLPFIVFAQPDTTQQIISGRRNAPDQQQKPYVILISADGFRYDYPIKHGAKNLLDLAGTGISSVSMIPSFPSLTFPNHYSIVTGLYPSHHGIVSNYFYDRDENRMYSMKAPLDGTWYGGTPLWVLAEQQHMLSASFYWVGTEAAIKGIYPTYYYHYNEIIPIEKRIEAVVNWLQLPEETRPHFITFYFPEVDHQGHMYGPDADETRAAVQFVDSSLLKLTQAVAKTHLPVNYIFVSDHGMTAVDKLKYPLISSYIDSSRFIIPRAFELIALYAKEKKDINPTYNKLKTAAPVLTVFKKNTVPAYLHYGTKDDIKNRIGDILLVPSLSLIRPGTGQQGGAHGFDPYLVKDMHAVFYAWGPAFKEHLQIPSFENVNVYPVIAQILGLKYNDKIDGTTKLARTILK